MIEEPFADGSSVIHRTDPRFRVMAATVLSIVIALSSEFTALLFSIGISLGLIIVANLNIRKVAGRLAVVSGFLVLLWLVLPVTHQGTTRYTVGPLNVTHEGILLAAQITLKSLSILALLISLIATMTVATLGSALNSLGVPGKFTQLLMVSYRYIFVIEQEYQRLMRAVRIRGFQPGTNLHTYRTYAYLAGMLFVRASMRAQRVYQAMLCRGFHGRYISLHRFSYGSQNQFFAVFMFLVFTIIVYLEWI